MSSDSLNKLEIENEEIISLTVTALKECCGIFRLSSLNVQEDIADGNADIFLD